MSWLREALFTKLELSNLTLVCQDWGGLLGLRLVAENPQYFARSPTLLFSALLSFPAWFFVCSLDPEWLLQTRVSPRGIMQCRMPFLVGGNSHRRRKSSLSVSYPQPCPHTHSISFLYMNARTFSENGTWFSLVSLLHVSVACVRVCVRMACIVRCRRLHHPISNVAPPNRGGEGRL